MLFFFLMSQITKPKLPILHDFFINILLFQESTFKYFFTLCSVPGKIFQSKKLCLWLPPKDFGIVIRVIWEIVWPKISKFWISVFIDQTDPPLGIYLTNKFIYLSNWYTHISVQRYIHTHTSLQIRLYKRCSL